MTETFPNVQISYSLSHDLSYATHVMDLGDGFEQRVNKNINWTHADGEGNSGIVYKGRNKFTITINRMTHVNEVTATHDANLLWNFFKQMLGNVIAFYFYNPIENTTRTGDVGKYLVRFQDPMLSREAFMLKVFKTGITLIEVRS